MKVNIDNIAYANDATNSYLLANIANDLLSKGYSINPMGFDTELAESLLQAYENLPSNALEHAGVGRSGSHMLNEFVRRDETSWISDSCTSTSRWIYWAEQLQTFLNRRLMLGLFSFESHFARYRKGQFYKRHLDSFKGMSNRVLSVVLYLNKDWALEDSGELVLYKDQLDIKGIKVTPSFGTLVVFLSEDFPHEVLKTNRDRISIAGWYRVNSSVSGRVDPPR